jgi:protein TonB
MLQKRYLREHFEYISALILKNLRYPPAARRMGWSGNVVVSFVVLENGSAEDIKVMKSSGFTLLDTNAVETVRKVSPFPKPPVRAELRIPVQYRLDQ